MKWIKSSERLPEKFGMYHVRIGPLKDKACWTRGKIMERAKEGGIEIEWLDEESNVSSQEPSIEKKTLVISAFPGVGKTYLSRFTDALDSDSSSFSWLPKTKVRNDQFPFNYIQHIKNKIGKYDFILVSSHKEVRTCLIQYGIDFLSVYPEKSLKDEYLKRYETRGDDDSFISMMNENWDSFIEGMEDLQVMQPLVLKSGQYLSDYFLLNSVQNAKECNATKVEGMSEPLAQNNSIQDIFNECADSLTDGKWLMSFQGFVRAAKKMSERAKFTMEDFEKGLMLAGLIKPANEQEQREFDLLNNSERGSE